MSENRASGYFIDLHEQLKLPDDTFLCEEYIFVVYSRIGDRREYYWPRT